jgi:hypothetical protein
MTGVGLLVQVFKETIEAAFCNKTLHLFQNLGFTTVVQLSS